MAYYDLAVNVLFFLLADSHSNAQSQNLDLCPNCTGQFQAHFRSSRTIASKRPTLNSELFSRAAAQRRHLAICEEEEEEEIFERAGLRREASWGRTRTGKAPRKKGNGDEVPGPCSHKFSNT